MKVLSKEPSARYRTADQLGRVLLKFGTQRDDPTPSPLDLTPEVSTTYQRSEQTPAPANFPTGRTLRPIAPEPVSVLDGIDWVSIGLGLLALLMIGGLIPLWISVIFAYNPPVR